MKIVQTANLHYHPLNSGVTKINRKVLERLVELGHEAMTVVPALPVPSPTTLEEHVAELASAGVHVRRADGVISYDLAGVKVLSLEDRGRFRMVLGQCLRRFEPDWVLVSSEDPSQMLLSTALEMWPGRVIYVANTTSMLPFGPQSFFPSAKRTALLGRAAAIVSVSKFLTAYIKEHAGLEAATIYPPIYDEGPFGEQSHFDCPFVTMINPSRIKGISIFTDLARNLPGLQFAAVPSWATTEDDLRVLEQFANVTVLPRSSRIDDVYAQTRVLLVPSLWAEALSMVPTEAMLRGIPVLASDVGGLPESKAGTDYLLPVAPGTGYEGELDAHFVPILRIPPQDSSPWITALCELAGNRALYERQSVAARSAAQRFAAGARVEVLADFLRGL